MEPEILRLYVKSPTQESGIDVRVSDVRCGLYGDHVRSRQEHSGRFQAERITLEVPDVIFRMMVLHIEHKHNDRPWVRLVFDEVQAQALWAVADTYCWPELADQARRFLPLAYSWVAKDSAQQLLFGFKTIYGRRNWTFPIPGDLETFETPRDHELCPEAEVWPRCLALQALLIHLKSTTDLKQPCLAVTCARSVVMFETICIGLDASGNLVIAVLGNSPLDQRYRAAILREYLKDDAQREHWLQTAFDEHGDGPEDEMNLEIIKNWTIDLALNVQKHETYERAVEHSTNSGDVLVYDRWLLHDSHMRIAMKERDVPYNWLFRELYDSGDRSTGFKYLPGHADNTEVSDSLTNGGYGPVYKLAFHGSTRSPTISVPQNHRRFYQTQLGMRTAKAAPSPSQSGPETVCSLDDINIAIYLLRQQLTRPLKWTVLRNQANLALKPEQHIRAILSSQLLEQPASLQVFEMPSIDELLLQETSLPQVPVQHHRLSCVRWTTRLPVIRPKRIYSKTALAEGFYSAKKPRTDSQIS